MPGCSINQHIDRVEKEEGTSFLLVLTDLAKSGESKSSAAEILDIPQTSLCKWLRNNPQQVQWPAKGKSNGFIANVQNSTPARQAARLRNLKLTATRR